MFLKLARSMISIPCKASNRHNFYGLQNATKTNGMLQILTNMKLTHDETLNILLVLYAFLHSLKRTIWIVPRHTGKPDFRGLWQSLKHIQNNGFRLNLLS